MYYLGIDLGGTGVKAGIVTPEGKIVAKKSAPTDRNAGYEEVAKLMANLAIDLVAESGYKMDDIISVGIGCPGSVDDKTGMVYYSNNIVMKNAPICNEMKKYIDKPIHIGNDANCAALGEFFALNDESVENFVAITLGTGVGGGIIIDRKLYTGFNAVAGELGHILLKMDGEPCTCGRNGCWEAYASATALIRDTERCAKENPDSLVAKLVAENGGKANGKIPFDAAQSGDEAGKSVVDNYIRYVGEGLADIINIFQPNIIAIGGGICNQGDNLLVPLKEYVSKLTYGAGIVTSTEIVIAKLGNDAGIIGAAFLGR